MVEKLKSNTTTLTDKIILTFNLEFVEVLCYDFAVKRENIWFVTDCKEKSNIIKHPHFVGVNSLCVDYLLWSKTTDMKFDVIVGNPPYNVSRNDNDTARFSLWDEFVKNSLPLLKENGYLCFVHPNTWRAVGHKLWPIMSSKQIHYLEIHGPTDGQKTFGCLTRYDWYVLQNTNYVNPTLVVNELGNKELIDFRGKPFISNFNLSEINKILANDTDKKCEVIYLRAYDTGMSCISKKKTSEFKYPIVKFIYPEEKIKMVFHYSNVNNKGGFGISKVLVNKVGIPYAAPDFDGRYAMTQNVIGIPISNENEGKLIIKAINSSKFRTLLESTRSTKKYIDYRVFKYFKKDFWKEFI